MKIIILLASLLGTMIMLLALYSVDLGICGVRDASCIISYDKVENILYFFPLALLFSLVTFFQPSHVFKSWFKFLLIWGPITLFITTLIHAGAFGLDEDIYTRGFGMLIVFILYGIFVLGSTLSITRARRVR